MLQLVKDGKAELAFVNMPISDDELCIEPCFEIHDMFVCSPRHQKKPCYSWEEIAHEPLILLEENSSSRHFLNAQFEDKGITLKPQIEIAAHDLLIRFASIDLGVSCVIEEFSKESLVRGLVLPMKLEPLLPPRNIGCAYLGNTPLSPASETFLNFIRQHSYSRKQLN